MIFIKFEFYKCYQAHMKTIHASTKNYSCTEDSCNRKFATMDHLVKHVKLHKNERNYECKDCNKKFLQKWYLLKKTLF